MSLHSFRRSGQTQTDCISLNSIEIERSRNEILLGFILGNDLQKQSPGGVL